ncbi:MAG: cytochrome bc complex cytochrome b subunit, partial [Tatlockia sp.]|nr:cytochrome bc complex cytochrome b subunit [Tatlockia sp.]
TLRDVLVGGGALNTTTVEHLYTIHSYLLSAGAILLAIVHLWSILKQEKEMKSAIASAPNLPAPNEAELT